jgi:hypothetical protein
MDRGMKSVSTLTLAALLTTLANSNAEAEQVLLSCWGTVGRFQQGKQINPKDEKHSIVVAVDIARKIVTVDDVEWKIFDGGGSKEKLSAAEGHTGGTLVLNRITGAITVQQFLVEPTRIENFSGKCKPAQRLF